MKFFKNIFVVFALLAVAFSTPQCTAQNKHKNKPQSTTQNQAKDQALSLTPPKGKAVAAFAEGCFWCAEHVFEAVAGVDEAVSGYAGGTVANPTYEAVGAHETGHAEAVLVYYDPKLVTYSELVKVFFASHDPTTLNRQGPDEGTPYRSVAFYQNNEEKMAIEKEIEAVNASKRFKNKVVTEVKPLEKFYKAEEYHQDYIQHNPDNPYVQHVSMPRFAAFKQVYKGKFK
jgi:peptide-methionine (S)-S-oxide reductase